jgi:hypothetical protein
MVPGADPQSHAFPLDFPDRQRIFLDIAPLSRHDV